MTSPLLIAACTFLLYLPLHAEYGMEEAKEASSILTHAGVRNEITHDQYHRLGCAFSIGSHHWFYTPDGTDTITDGPRNSCMVHAVASFAEHRSESQWEEVLAGSASFNNGTGEGHAILIFEKGGYFYFQENGDDPIRLDVSPEHRDSMSPLMWFRIRYPDTRFAGVEIESRGIRHP